MRHFVLLLALLTAGAASARGTAALLPLSVQQPSTSRGLLLSGSALSAEPVRDVGAPSPLLGPARAGLGLVAAGGLGFASTFMGVVGAGWLRGGYDGMVVAGAAGAVLGSSLGMWGVGQLMGGDGVLLPTVLGSAVGLGVGGLGMASSGGLLSPWGVPLMLGGAALGAMVGFELSSVLVFHARRSTRLALLPYVSGTTQGAGLALSARF